MKIPAIRIGQLVAATLMAAGGLALAQTAQLPAEHHEGAVAYVSGGVSSEDAALFKQAKTRYPLAIELVEQSGGKRAEYTAGARVRIVDAAGMLILDARAEGPFMLVRLPAGQYRVQATLKDRSVESRPLHVTDKGSTSTMLEFPAGAG